MIIEYTGIKSIVEPLIMIEGVEDVSYDELVEIRLSDGTVRTGNVIDVSRGKAVVQVFEGTNGMSLGGVSTRFSGKPLTRRCPKRFLAGFLTEPDVRRTDWEPFTQRRRAMSTALL